MLDREPLERAFEHLNVKHTARKNTCNVHDEGERTTGDASKAETTVRRTKRAASNIEVSKSEALAILSTYGRFPQVSTAVIEETFREKARQHVETLKANLCTYELEPEEAYDAEKATDDLLFSSTTVVSDMQNEEDLY